MTNPSGFRKPEQDAYWAARRAAQKLTVHCALCPWHETGLAGDVLPAQREHRREVHGLRPQRRKKGTSAVARRDGSPPRSQPVPASLLAESGGTDGIGTSPLSAGFLGAV
jgi:hypothetical protein